MNRNTGGSRTAYPPANVQNIFNHLRYYPPYRTGADNSHLPRGRSSGRQRPALSPLWMKETLIVPSPRVRDSVHSYRESHLGPHSPRNPLHPRHSFELCQFLSTSIYFPPCITEHPRSQGPSVNEHFSRSASGSATHGPALPHWWCHRLRRCIHAALGSVNRPSLSSSTPSLHSPLACRDSNGVFIAQSVALNMFEGGALSIQSVPLNRGLGARFRMG
jgi:hypothetical protein